MSSQVRPLSAFTEDCIAFVRDGSCRPPEACLLIGVMMFAVSELCLLPFSLRCVWINEQCEKRYCNVAKGFLQSISKLSTGNLPEDQVDELFRLRDEVAASIKDSGQTAEHGPLGQWACGLWCSKMHALNQRYLAFVLLNPLGNSKMMPWLLERLIDRLQFRLSEDLFFSKISNALWVLLFQGRVPKTLHEANAMKKVLKQKAKLRVPDRAKTLMLVAKYAESSPHMQHHQFESTGYGLDIERSLRIVEDGVEIVEFSPLDRHWRHTAEFSAGLVNAPLLEEAAVSNFASLTDYLLTHLDRLSTLIAARYVATRIEIEEMLTAIHRIRTWSPDEQQAVVPALNRCRHDTDWHELPRKWSPGIVCWHTEFERSKHQRFLDANPGSAGPPAMWQARTHLMTRFMEKSGEDYDLTQLEIRPDVVLEDGGTVRTGAYLLVLI
jgi:hypothetical protein